MSLNSQKLQLKQPIKVQADEAVSETPLLLPKILDYILSWAEIAITSTHTAVQGDSQNTLFCSQHWLFEFSSQPRRNLQLVLICSDSKKITS